VEFIGHRLRNSLGRKLSILYQKPILNFGQFTWNRYLVPAYNRVKYLTTVVKMEAIHHDSSLNRRCM